MVEVLRLGHRRGRDDRISTHVALTARQFGASSVTFSGERDDSMLESVRDVVERWGGPFDIRYREDWRNVIRDFDGPVIHLTMYGVPYYEDIDGLEGDFGGSEDDILVVVGGEKVPSEVFEIADYNLAIGNQPHSEVAALAVFLHDLFQGDWTDREFEDAEIEVFPSEEGKETRKTDTSS
ncbi:MAG: tRNA (cytidine(56)-2'-O)-methyltransferase [Candidatus Nanohaloarchaeota archaeon QJJ-7]|nr:tRNA (cytidine(56)-2'-O)-methyltransferase [Candidatus Nanohaloarchaeota archaeon QJJ-7]